MTSSLPKIGLAVLIAGFIGEISFELYAHLISPIIFGPSLQPANLVIALGKIYGGFELNYVQAFIVHSLIGSIGFATTVVLIKKISGLGYVIAGGLTGFILWFVAQGMLAPAIGRPFMMEFGTYTQSSFVAHVGMSIIIGIVLKKMLFASDSTPSDVAA